MKFDIKKFKKNLTFLGFCFALIIVIFAIDSISGGNKYNLDKEDLTNDDINVNGLVLNEIMTANKGVISSSDGNLYDYVEIYNGTNKDIDLKGYGLSDDSSSARWAFPDVTVKSKNYVVVFLSGKTMDGLNANFKLKNSGGEVVTLFKPNGKVEDSIETIALDSNMVMARNSEGKWVQTSPTPGFENTKNGQQAFYDSLLIEEKSDIQITEFLPNNNGNFKNENGEYSGYIEIKNTGKKNINITNYSLSNDENVSFKWQFPNTTLVSGETLLIYTSGTSSKEGTLSTSFKLQSTTGSVILSNNEGKVIDKVNYENLGNGLAYIKESDTFNIGSSISPGYENTTDGIKSFQKKYLQNPNDLIINEAMNSNYKYLAQNAGNYYDWIELYNNTSDTIKLSDYCLTTSTNSICMYKLPDVELKKGEYYVVMASGDENLSNKNYKHTNFKLSDTEHLFLTKGTKIIDSLFMYDIPKGYSIGRGSEYGIYYYSKPTPKAKNDNGSIAVSFAPSASKESGIYNDTNSFKVALTGAGTIYYTLDGSTPTTSSKIYSSPLTIKKTTVLRIMSKEKGKLKSDVLTYSYIVNENHKVAVMSIAIDKSKLSNVDSHTSLNSSVIEQCDVELLETDGTGFKIGAGLKLFGGSTRSYKKKSYEIKFKKQFGSGELNYAVFDDVDSSVYTSLVLRTGSQDEFQYNDQRTVIKDVVATSLAQEYTDLDVQDYKSIILYINGNYRGIYFIREKVDENFVANHYNVKTTKSDTSILRIDGEVKTGTNKAYNSMINWITSNSLSNSSNYNKIKEQIDIQSLCDFWIGEMYTANYDILNTRYFSNKNVDNGKWKFIFYDLDSGFFRTTENPYTEYTSASGAGSWNFPTTLLRNLMKSSEFKKTFLERLSYNLKNTWSTKNITNRIDEVINEFGKDEFKRNAERWGNSYSHWQTSITRMKTFAKQRPSYMVSYAKSYFGLSNSEVKKYFGDL